MSEYMIFCLGEGKYESKGIGYQKNYMIFNKQVDKETYQKVKNSLNIELVLTHWVDKKDMTDDEKENISVWKEIGGYLKTFTYQEAWSNWWKEATQDQKNTILNIPQFDAEIFKGITGLDVSKDTEVDNAIKLLTDKGLLKDGKILIK